MKLREIRVAVPDETASWAEHADPQQVARALENGRRREAGQRAIDGRIAMPGRRGMDARVTPGHLHGGGLAAAADVSLTRVNAWRRAGAIHAEPGPTGAGQVTLYGRDECRVALVLGCLEAVTGQLTGSTLRTIAGRLRDLASTRGRWLVLTRSGPQLISDAGILDAIRQAGAAAVVSLGAVEGRLAEALA